MNIGDRIQVGFTDESEGQIWIVDMENWCVAKVPLGRPGSRDLADRIVRCFNAFISVPGTQIDIDAVHISQTQGEQDG